MQQNPVIGKPIGKLALTESFKEMSFFHDFRTLADILNWPVSVLLLHQGFTYHHYQELRNLLSRNEMLQLLKAI